MTHNHSSPCLHDRQYGAPDEVVRCKCGGEPMAGYSTCPGCELAFLIDHPAELADTRANPRLQSPAELELYARADAAMASGYRCTFCTRPASVYGPDPRSACCHAVARRPFPRWRAA
jgi:hypothetical protein